MIGTKVHLRTKEYVIPSLSFDEVAQFALDGTLEQVPNKGAGLFVPAMREAAMAVLLSALKWNYPEITREEVARELDLDNCERAMAAVLGATGLVKRENDAGEAKP